MDSQDRNSHLKARANGLASTDQAGEGTESGVDELVEQELMVEEISIDGMCGVY